MRRALAGEADLWSHTVGRGFFEQPELTTEEMDVGRAIFAMPGAMCYLAVGGDRRTGRRRGRWPFAAAWPRCLPTAPFARFRRRGLHRELIAARLNEAVAQGCDLATASTLPGSASQRNYERAGLRGGLYQDHPGGVARELSGRLILLIDD